METRPTAPLLECRGVVRRFLDRRGPLPVLNGVDLGVCHGEAVVITGRSGTGKSTLLGLLAGLEPPDAGVVLLDGRDISSLPERELTTLRRERIGVLFQRLNLLPAWTAVENVEAAFLPTVRSRTERRARAEALLSDVGLGDRRHHLPSELSAGEEQRVALARALANEPDILLADEPTGDVDPETAEAMTERLLHPVRTGKAALVVATHGVFPTELATRVFRLAGGTLARVQL